MIFPHANNSHAIIHAPSVPVVKARRSTRRNRATCGAATLAFADDKDGDNDEDNDGTGALESLLSSPLAVATSAPAAAVVVFAFAVTSAPSVKRDDAEVDQRGGGRPPCRRGVTIILLSAKIATERPGE